MTTNFESLSVVRELKNRPIVFGVALASYHLENPEIAKIARYVFDSVTCENEMKPSNVRKSNTNSSNYLTSDSYNFRIADTIVNYAKNNSMKVLGHTLWYDPNNNPLFIRNFALTTSQTHRTIMSNILSNHIRENINHFNSNAPDVVYKWHVTNESLDDSGNVITAKRNNQEVEAARVLGTGYFSNMYSMARSILNSNNNTKNVKIYYNDYRNMMNQFNTLKLIKDAGNLDGIGIQCHADELKDLDNIRETTQLYRKEGFEVHYSEIDYRAKTATDSNLSEFYADLLQIALDYGVNNFTVWGIKDDLSWLYSKDYAGNPWSNPTPNRFPLLFNNNLQPKACYNALINKLKDYEPIQDYDIFIILGQSNSVGYGRDIDNPIPRIGTNMMTDDYNNRPNNNIKQLKRNTFNIEDAIEQIDHLWTRTDPANPIYGFAVSFARQYVRENKLGENRKVLLIGCGVGATGFFDTSKAHWRRDTNYPVLKQIPSRLYDSTLQRLKNGITPGKVGPNSLVKGILWLQGEDDASDINNDSNKIPTYKSYVLDTLNNLRLETLKFINNVRLGSNQNVASIPILMGSLMPGLPNYVTMNQTIKSITDNSGNNINYRFVSAEPIPNSVFTNTLKANSSSDAAHYNKSSQIELGKRYFYVYNNNNITVS